MIQEPPAVPIQVDDTPTEPATSPRRMLIQQFENGQLTCSFQLENMVRIQNQSDMPLDSLSMKLNGLQKNMSKCCVKQLKASMSIIGIEKLEKKLNEPIESMLKVWQIGEPASKLWVSKHIQQHLKVHLRRVLPLMRVLPDVHEALRQHDPTSEAPASQPSLPKKAPPTTGKGMPAGLYRVEEPPRPRIGSG